MFLEITPEDYVEGPVMFIRDGKYYFMWPEGGQCLKRIKYDYKMDRIVSRSQCGNQSIANAYNIANAHAANLRLYLYF